MSDLTRRLQDLTDLAGIAVGREAVDALTAKDATIERLNKDLISLSKANTEAVELANKLTAEVRRLTAIETAVRELEPYFDQLICYASTPSEFKPNLLVKNMREALADTEDK